MSTPWIRITKYKKVQHNFISLNTLTNNVLINNSNIFIYVFDGLLTCIVTNLLKVALNTITLSLSIVTVGRSIEEYIKSKSIDPLCKIFVKYTYSTRFVNITVKLYHVHPRLCTHIKYNLLWCPTHIVLCLFCVFFLCTLCC